MSYEPGKPCQCAYCLQNTAEYTKNLVKGKAAGCKCRPRISRLTSSPGQVPTTHVSPLPCAKMARGQALLIRSPYSRQACHSALGRLGAAPPMRSTSTKKMLTAVPSEPSHIRPARRPRSLSFCFRFIVARCTLSIQPPDPLHTPGFEPCPYVHRYIPDRQRRAGDGDERAHEPRSANIQKSHKLCDCAR